MKANLVAMLAAATVGCSQMASMDNLESRVDTAYDSHPRIHQTESNQYTTQSPSPQHDSTHPSSVHDDITQRYVAIIPDGLKNSEMVWILSGLDIALTDHHGHMDIVLFTNISESPYARDNAVRWRPSDLQRSLESTTEKTEAFIAERAHSNWRVITRTIDYTEYDSPRDIIDALSGLQAKRIFTFGHGSTDEQGFSTFITAGQPHNTYRFAWSEYLMHPYWLDTSCGSTWRGDEYSHPYRGDSDGLVRYFNDFPELLTVDPSEYKPLLPPDITDQ